MASNMKANVARTIFLSVLLVTLWALVHHYRITGDGELYALQAMSRIDSALSADIYLAAHSRDELTLFSPLYAFAIRWLGLWRAGCALYALCTFGFLASCWTIARRLWNDESAWLAVAMMAVSISAYGAYGVFHSAEGFLTARTMAEALVLASLAVHYSGMPKASWTIAVCAMLIHPLMGLPGLLLLACLSFPVPWTLAAAATGVCVAVSIALMAAAAPHPPAVFALMTGPWLDMVRERSQFLFLQLWRPSDWELHARDLLCLALAFLSTEDERVRRLCVASAVVGLSGLAIGFIASSIGPVAILLQGQAWRWFWVTGCISLLMVLPIATRLWREDGCGSISAVLTVGSWTFPPAHGAWLAGGALLLFIVGQRAAPPTAATVRLLAYLVMGVMLVWTFAQVWDVFAARPVQSGAEPDWIERMRQIFALQLMSLLVVVLAVYWRPAGNPSVLHFTAALALLVVCGLVLHGSFEQSGSAGRQAEFESVSDWRERIPPGSNVLVLPDRNSAAFIWFSLQRPSYITLDQSAGVVFSQSTALEIRRRSQVLAAVESPDWKILSYMSRSSRDGPVKERPPLTAGLLVSICRDEQLGFVVAKEDLGFGALRHRRADEWKDWYLYDCSSIRRAASST